MSTLNYGRPGQPKQQQYRTSFSITNRKYPSMKLKQVDVGRQVIILPSRSMQMNPNDELWMGSVDNYRYIPDKKSGPEYRNEHSGFGQFTGWFQPIEAHYMFGKSGKDAQKRSFLSPYTLGATGKTGVDALSDVFWHIKGLVNKDKNHPLYGIINKVGQNYAYLEKSRDRLVGVNALIKSKDGKGENGWDQTVIFMTNMAFNYLVSHGEDKGALGELNMEAGRNDPMRGDPFDAFKLGDVTNLENACVGYVDMVVSPGGFGMPAIKFIRAGQPIERMNLVELYGKAFVDKVLLNRCPITQQNLQGVDTYNLHSYQEMVDFMVEDGVVPLEILEEVCGRYATINVPTKGHAQQPEAETNEEDELDYGPGRALGGAPAPQQQQRPAPAPAPIAQPTSAAREAVAHPTTAARSIPQAPQHAAVIEPHAQAAVPPQGSDDAWGAEQEAEYLKIRALVFSGKGFTNADYDRLTELARIRPINYKG